MRRSTLFLAAVTIGVTAGLLAPTPTATAAAFNMYAWMQPPVGPLGAYVCLTNSWHPSGYGDPEHLSTGSYFAETTRANPPYYRSRNAAPDEGGSYVFGAAKGEPVQRPDISCEGQILRHAWVRVRATYDGLQKGIVMYQHVRIWSTATFWIYFQAGGSFTNAYMNDHAFGETTDDGPSNRECWTNFHVHENNSKPNTAGSYWDKWNEAYYDTAPPSSYHLNSHKHRWTRRLHWVEG